MAMNLLEIFGITLRKKFMYFIKINQLTQNEKRHRIKLIFDIL